MEILKCAMCGQGAHNQCLANLLGISEQELIDLGPSEAKARINPFKIPGFIYMCEVCKRDSVPIVELIQPPDTPAATAVADHPFDAQGAAAAVNQNQNSTLDDEAVSQNVQALADRHVPSQQLQVPPRQEDPNQQYQTDQSNALICGFYKRGICRFGLSGKGCSKQHPKACYRLIQHGTRGPNGCNRGTNCSMFHPKMCQQSIAVGECLTLDCPLRHVRGTRRSTTSRPLQSFRNNQQSAIPPLMNQNTAFRNSNLQIPQNQPMQSNFLDMMQAMKREISQLAQQIQTMNTHIPQQTPAPQPPQRPQPPRPPQHQYYPPPTTPPKQQYSQCPYPQHLMQNSYPTQQMQYQHQPTAFPDHWGCPTQGVPTY